MHRSSSRRALMVVALVLLLVLAALDLTSRNSLLRGMWGDAGAPGRQERLQELQRRAIPERRGSLVIPGGTRITLPGPGLGVTA